MSSQIVKRAPKRDEVEVLKIVKRVRAKSEDDSGFARIYLPGEEGRFKGAAKLQLLSMKSATRDLNAEIPDQKKEKTKEPIPNLHGMKNDELDLLAENLGIDVSNLKRPEKIAAIKDAY